MDRMAKRDDRAQSTFTTGEWRCAGAVAVVLFGVLAMFFFRDFWVTQEARDYYSGDMRVGIHLGEFFLSPKGSNSRPLSMLLSETATDLFGPSTQIVNLIQIGILSVSLYLMYWHTLSVTGRPASALFGFFLTCFSAPMANMLLWQATQHDKLMAFYSLVILIVHFRFVTLDRKTVPRLASYTLFLILLVSLASNSKETSLFILPAILAQAILLRRNMEPLSWQLFFPSAIVLLYLAIFYYSYFSSLSDNWGGHIQSASPLETIPALLQYLFLSGNFMNLGEWGQASSLRSLVVPVTAFVSLLFLASLFVPFAGHDKRDARETRSGALYFLVMAGTVLALSSRTSYPNAYYMFVPQWALGAVIGLAVSRLLRANSFLRLSGSALGAVLVACAMAGFLAYFLPGGAGERLLAGSRKLQDLSAIMRAYADAGTRSFQIRTEGNLDGSWYLLQGISHPIDPNIAAFVFGVPTSVAPQILPSDWRELGADDTIIVLGVRYNILEAPSIGGP